MKTRKIIALLLMAAMLLALTACGTQQTTATQQPAAESQNVEAEAPAAVEEETFNIMFPHIYADDHFEAILFEEFAANVEEMSGGTLHIECYPNSTLATEEQIYEGLRNGTYSMGVMGMMLQDVMPQVGGLQYPFLFDDFAAAKNALFDNDYGFQIFAGSEEYNILPLAINANGFRVMTLNKRIESMDDFKGFKMRTANLTNMINCFTNLGCSVVPMSMSEVFTALEQGVIDGQENPPSQIKTSGWYEIQDYMMLSNHVFSADVICINYDFWNQLSENQQNVLREASRDISEKIWAAAEAAYNDDLEYIRENSDIEIYTPSDEFRKDMKAAIEVQYEELYEKVPEYVDLLNKIRGIG